MVYQYQYSQAVYTAAYRNAMSNHASSVSVITTLFEGQRFGFTASAVCSVSDEPPTLLVCINRASSCFEAFADAELFCVNTLSANQKDIASAFAAKISQAERFQAGIWDSGADGLPILKGASVNFLCQKTQYLDMETHRILFGRVLDAQTNDVQNPLIYCQRQYCAVTS